MKYWTTDGVPAEPVKGIAITSDVGALRDEIDAIVYARVSTQDQVKHGYSLESQVEKSVAFAQSKFGIDDNRILAVIERGEMGDNANRTGLTYALGLLEHGVGRVMIVLHPDRLARNLKLQLSITDRIWNAGCEIAFVEMDVNPSNPESVLLYNIQGAIAQYNKAKILANSKRGRRTKVRNGQIPGLRRIYGYQFDKTSDMLVPIPEEQRIYRKMVDWALHGRGGRDMNLTAIARELSLLGIPAPCGDKWYQATVSRILRNPVYKGTFFYGKTEYKQSAGQTDILRKPENEWQMVPVPALIDEETFFDLQEKLNHGIKRGRGTPATTTTYLLKGLVRCGRCGSAIVAGAPSRNKTTKEIRYHYYVCSKKGRKVFEVGSGREVHTCPGSNWRKDIIEATVWRVVSDWLVAERDALRQILQYHPKSTFEDVSFRCDSLLSAIEKMETERKRWIQLSVKGYISEDELNEGLLPISKHLQELQKQLAEAHQKLSDLKAFGAIQASAAEDPISDFLTYLQFDVQANEKIQIMHALQLQVVLNDDQIVISVPWQVPHPRQ